MSDDEVIASLPAEALTLFQETWGRGGLWVECPTGENWIYASMLKDAGLLEMHVDTPPYFVITDRGRRASPAIQEFLRARKALR
jgi:hypothetical protein